MFAKVRYILTIRCREASRLASESLDRRLLVHERLALRLHQVVCWSCRQFERQLRLLRDAANRLHQAPSESQPDAELSAAAKQRLKNLPIDDSL
ncbi:MAG TPA: hypothetical protein DDW52_12700 [Planctomycetaceae bacterium]|nr:hypothetical protein [Planctomycetaceae bacterium]